MAKTPPPTYPTLDLSALIRVVIARDVQARTAVARVGTEAEEDAGHGWHVVLVLDGGYLDRDDALEVAANIQAQLTGKAHS